MKREKEPQPEAHILMHIFVTSSEVINAYRRSFQNQLLIVRGCHELLSVKVGHRDRISSHIQGAVQECLVRLKLEEHVGRRRLSGQDMQCIEAGDNGQHGLEVAVIPQHPEKLQTLQQHVQVVRHCMQQQASPEQLMLVCREQAAGQQGVV